MDLSTLGIDVSINIPIAVLMYVVAEFLKITILKNNTARNLIPISCAILGGIAAIVFSVIWPSSFEGQEPLNVMTSGIVSGLIATGGNQLFKRTKEFGNSVSSDE